MRIYNNILYIFRDITLIFLISEEMSENHAWSPGIFALYIWNHRTRCFIPLYMHIRISAGCISNLILSVGASAGSVKSFPGDSSLCVCFLYFSFFTASSRPLGKIYSTRKIEKKKDEPAARDVHAKLFKWVAPDGIRNSVKFRAKRKKSRGRIGLHEFRNPRLYEW